MSLGACVHCGRQGIAEDAPNCPQCGGSEPNPNSARRESLAGGTRSIAYVAPILVGVFCAVCSTVVGALAGFFSGAFFGAGGATGGGVLGGLLGFAGGCALFSHLMRQVRETAREAQRYRQG